jgi:hypothetical protein
MKLTRRHWVLVGVVIFALLAAGAGGFVLTRGEHESEQARGDELPSALADHLEHLREAIPGDGGESGESPGGAAQDQFQALAYPGKTVTIEKINRSENAFRNARGRSATSATSNLAPVGRWQQLGPSQAEYPFSPLRNAGNYVPNKYIAGGRTTSVAINSTCTVAACRLYATPAGGGVWRTDNALAATPSWTYLGGPLGINAAGTVSIDPNDATGDTIYVGTGEPNVCASGCVAGVGLYKSTDGGGTWTGPLGGAATDSGNPLGGKGIGSIVIPPGQPNTIYVGTTTALRGYTSVCCSGVQRPVPDAAKWGLYKSTDGGSSWTFIHNGSADATKCTGSNAEFNNQSLCSPRGVPTVALDPTDPDVVYAASFARGVWRSSDAGVTWTQIHPSLAPNTITTRPAFAVTTLPNGNTRMYLYEGNVGTPYSRLFRSDSVRTGAPTFQDLTSSNPKNPGYATYNSCTGQCWYDMYVVTPPGNPDVVYIGGSYVYGETGGISNGRGVVLSTDAGVSGTDMTMDGTDETHPNGIHPDQHALVTVPGKPMQFIEASDGGLIRSSGDFVDRSSWCGDRHLNGQTLQRCRQLLSKIPSTLSGVNDGLNTLQFQSLSADPRAAGNLQGGTQDNGTWQSGGSTTHWLNEMIGDGGQSGFDAAEASFRFHTFTGASPDVNFNNGNLADWIWTGDPMAADAGSQFYVPIISDPQVSGTMFAGTGATVYRTTTFGLGNRTRQEANRICNEWTGTFEATCGDWAKTGPVDLTAAGFDDRAGGAVAAVERTTTDTSTAWAATTTGRVFRSTNIDATSPADIRWTRLDDKVAAQNDPNRFVSSIYPVDANTAYVSYSGYNATTPSTPGHVFRVDVTGPTSATWTDMSYNLGDLPITDLVRDPQSRDLYASSDFGVLRLPSGTTSWVLAAPGMPNMEVAGLTLAPQGGVLYAASHGQGAWKLQID